MTETITRIENGNEIDSLLNKHFLTKIRSGFVEVGENKYCLPVSYEKFRDDLQNFEVRDSDVYLIAHPKTGTTWALEMIWLIINDLNYEGAKKPNYIRSRNLDASMYTENKMDLDINYMDQLNQIPAPRFLRCHLPWSLLPEQIKNGTKKPKIISIVRSAEDVCVSYYHHCKLMEGYTGSFDEFCQLFIAGRVCFGPFWKSVVDTWQHRHSSNLHFIQFAEMKKNLTGVIKDVAQFLERDLNDDAVEQLAKHLDFEKMKHNPAVNMTHTLDSYCKTFNLTTAAGDFIRKGAVGGYKSEMTEEQIELFKKWTQESLEGTDMNIEELYPTQ
ncbi:hypothetical protein FQA39_LY17558 [Lamprigera yunnana]|nr:hypothetical protein FQA39_LY17558 [Lamprigera yunnana]